MKKIDDQSAPFKGRSIRRLEILHFYCLVDNTNH